MPETEIFRVELTRDEAENLRGTLVKHSTAIVVKKIQRQILDALDRANSQDNDYYVARYGQPDLFTNNEK